MRGYKILTVIGAVAAMAGCAGEDGADGAAGAKGDPGAPGTPGEPGEPGTPGTPGTNGTNGTDGVCAGVAPLVVDEVDVDAVVFPDSEVALSFALSGGRAPYGVTFMGITELADGRAVVPATPTAGAEPLSYTLQTGAEGTSRYVAIITDGCTVATADVVVRAVAARVSFVHLYPDLGAVGLTRRGETTLLQPTRSAGESGDYLVVTEPSLELDLYPDADNNNVIDADADPIELRALDLAPGDHRLLVAHADAAGDLQFAVLSPEQSPYTNAALRVQLANFAPDVASVALADNDALTAPAFDDVAFATLSGTALLSAGTRTLYMDSDGDDLPNHEISVPLVAPATAGDYVVLFAWRDADGAMRLAGHVTDVDSAFAPGGVSSFSAEVRPYLGSPDETARVATPTPVDPESTADFELDLQADADCAVANLVVRYDIVTVSPTWASDVSFALTAPSGTTYTLGRGTAGTGGAESGKFETQAPRFEGVDGTWTVSVTNNYTGALTVNSLQLDVYCGESLGEADKVVAVDIDPDVLVPDDGATPVTSTATVTGACTVKFINVEWAVTHPYASDLEFALMSPAGDEFVLLGRPSGQFAVTGAFNLIESFAGESAVGTWTLQVIDRAPNDEGTLDAWTLSVYCE